MDLSTALSAEHHHELQWDSCITPSIMSERGYRTLTGTAEDRDLLESLGFRPYVWNREDAYPGLLIPMYGMTGEVRGHQFKPATPRMRARIKSDGVQVVTPVKYETPAKEPLVVDVPAFTREKLREDPGAPLWITEGIKKTDALVSRSLAAVGITGVFNWRNSMGTLGDWEEIPIKGRPAVICFDSDAASNRNVQLAMSRLGAWLRSRGASAVHYVVVPAQVGETAVKGVDDYFAAGGDVEGLHGAATQTAPGAGEKDAAFTDAFLVEELAEALEGRFCWASGLGWLQWNGRVWSEVSDVPPLEAVRVWAAEQFDKVLTQQRQEPARNLQGQIAGWRAILGKSRLTALRDLARGLLQRDAAEFDGDPDLLTCTNGTVHLPTGRLLPFDPEHYITKSADAEYRPGYRHPQWEAALTAVSADMHDWYRDRIGQGLTGYPVPDHTMVIAHGSGSNGKSVLVSVIRRTLGDYGVLISDRVLMASPDAHPTELMDLRGARYAVMEETPEARHLNVQRMKTILGSETIKARRIRQDPVEFLASHSLFINTNYRPVVTETDWGTWRRLALMPFPYTFRKPGVPLDTPWDRTGDPKLAYAANDADVRAAALVWAVQGAREWYARGRMMLETPAQVEQATREWRAETDLILGFADDCLKFTPDAFTQTREMLAAFNEWAGDRGHRPWNDRTFATRFGDHETIRGAKVRQGRFSVGGKQQRGWSGVEVNKEGLNPWTGEREDPPAPLPHKVQGTDPIAARFLEREEPLTQPCGDVPGEGPACDWDPQCRDHFPQAPVAIGFDLETADADKLFTGGHEGPFVRLAGMVNESGDVAKLATGPDVDSFVKGLNRADVVYGHNVLGFDLLALAYHHGADYDALAAKAVDTLALARLIDPPLSKGMPNGYYGLDAVAQRLGHEGKTDDLKALAKRYGGFDRIPLDSREYQDYLRGDLAATKHTREALVAKVGEQSEEQQLYACREMEIVALQNRMTLNGWAVDTELLAERVAHEDAQRAEAVRVLSEEYGMPLAKPDRIRMKAKREWPADYRTVARPRFSWTYPKCAPCSQLTALGQEPLGPCEDCGERTWEVNPSMGYAVAVLRRYASLFPHAAAARGFCDVIPGEVYASPWATDGGREAIIAAFAAAGAPAYPVTKTGALALSSDALGEKPWYDAAAGKSRPGMLQEYGHLPEVRRIVEAINQATGARAKYAEIAKYVTDRGRVHAWIGDAQGSGRWAMTKPSITNIGIRGAAKEERAVLVADPGHMLIAVDASQVDMRAMAGLSQDPAYMALFEPGRDAHSEMAVVYFGQLTPRTRQQTKAINHKLNYGGAAKSTAEMNGIPLEVVEQAIRAREENYPRLVEYINEVRQEAAAGRLLDNGFGRKLRPNPERAWTQGPALVGQGAARDIVCQSLLRFLAMADEAGHNARPYLRGVVHDELVLSVPADQVTMWAELLERAFTWKWKNVPILCEVSKPAFRWSECK